MANDYQIRPFSKARVGVADVLRLAEHKHIIHGLIEVDVTTARQFIRDYEARTGEQLSFTAFIIACVGKAVDANKLVNTYRWGRRKLITFNDVDVNTMIERVNPAGEKVVIPYVVRAANRKTYYAINREIWDIQAKPIEGPMPKSMQIIADVMLSLPWVLRGIFWRIMAGNPHRWRQWGGTVGVTAIGMFGEGSGWGVPVTPNTLMVTVGGISRKPGVIEDRIEIREYLSLTVSLDHDIVDGAPAARFAACLKDIIESGYGLLQTREAAAP
ncbi:MAG: 2-oxo acid dehydrogenase subunit E2 [Anaerolineae bacterium]|nr:2-oxo acid dehydrogenase subunit E2 [Anaerolineae bacterium]